MKGVLPDNDPDPGVERTRQRAADRGATVMDGWDMAGWGWGWMALMMIVGILLVVLLALVLLRGFAPGLRSDDRDDPARILAQRLARGEIDEEGYRRRRSLLRSADGPPAP